MQPIFWSISGTDIKRDIEERLTLTIGTFIIVSLIKIALALFVLLTAVAYTVWLERKVVGHIQNRWGPTRVGPFGLLQPAADGVKFLFKEDMTPPHVYKPLYIAAPMIAVVFASTSIAVIPDRQLRNIGRITHRRCKSPTSILGCSWSSASLRSASMASRFPAGLPTASIPCSADCVPARK